MGRYQRIADLADLDHPGLNVVDLATGAGLQVRALLAVSRPDIRVHAIDSASGLDDELLHDARVRSVLADLDENLPFADASVDRLISLNVAEHLINPAAHLAECQRVLKPGGLMVLAHSDWDTAMFTAPHDDLTRQLVDKFVATVPTFAERADGFMGRKLLNLAYDCGLDVVKVDTWADPHRRFDPGSVGWKVAMGVLVAVRDDAELTKAATEWVAQMRELASKDRFLFTVTDVAIVLRRAH